uniref:CDP-glycerol:poly(Glycerophosphate) glycerophosphotransferase (YidC, spoIIIJ, OXA1) n=1 Tax=uncultured marine thaumarchaeote KM3_13_H10 TaxID=1456008 RepID=A0A075GCI1_9ARCH|nr:CDP-glycerol:poly(glycerophosphate) glycerophosphotransferase (yidC, spoIIIJ, OXA1) [uncultured marine thaumarchaeote KM3_13_H10]
MKLSKSIFSKEANDMDKFNELDLDERSIVFYSESSVLLYPYVEQIIKELEKRDQKICYLTSSKDDPVLKSECKNIKVFYIGDSEIEKTKFFLRLKAKVLIMTMPDLEKYWVKRSKVFPVHYIYAFHSMNSIHMEFQKQAFDNFDSIFCVGPYQIQELRATEQLYNLKRKNLVECGYGLLDKLLESKPLYTQQNFASKNNKKKILIAPSWGKQNLLETVGIDLVKILLDTGYHVTVRPHPMSIKQSSKIIKKIREKFEENADFIFDNKTSSFDQLFSSYALITDWSGIGYEYAFVCERPVIYVDVPKKARNKDYEKIKLVPLEISIRDKIGEIISTQSLESIPERIEFLYGHVNEFQNRIKEIRDNTVFNIGKSGQVTSNEIMKIINEEKHE